MTRASSSFMRNAEDHLMAGDFLNDNAHFATLRLMTPMLSLGQFNMTFHQTGFVKKPKRWTCIGFLFRCYSDPIRASASFTSSADRMRRRCRALLDSVRRSPAYVPFTPDVTAAIIRMTAGNSRLLETGCSRGSSVYSRSTVSRRSPPRPSSPHGRV